MHGGSVRGCGPGIARRCDRVLAAAKARAGVATDAPVRSCYEAGRDGCWPHRFLTAVGVTNLVVDSSSIEVPRRARRAKTDRLDGEKLLRLLLRHWGGERDMWHVVHVPAREVEDARHASRGLTTLQAERTRYRNRIDSLLALHGVPRMPLGRPVSRAARDDAPLGAGVPLPPPGRASAGARTWRLLQAVETERHRRRRTERQQFPATATTARTPAQRLARLRGIAARSATVLADELFSRDLHNRREVGALTGLVSAPYRSDTIARDQGIAPSGLPAVRRVAVTPRGRGSEISRPVR